MAFGLPSQAFAIPFSNNLDSDQGTIYLRIIWMIIRD